MSSPPFVQVLCVALCGLLSVTTIASLEAYIQDSCDVNIQGCEYNIKISPKSKTCEAQNVFTNHRKRRTLVEESESNQKLVPVTRDDLNKINKKVARALEKLSVRVLRWWRKLDRKVSQLALTNRGARSQSMRLRQQCPDGFIGVENWPSCYLMSHFNTSWYNAKDYCSAFESDLVAMGTVREHFLLTFLIKNNPAISGAAGWWTSGSFLGSTRQWMWTSQFFTKPFTFIKWAEGEPNEEGSQCMLLRRDHNHQWNDDICTEDYNFICEVGIQVV